MAKQVKLNTFTEQLNYIDSLVKEVTGRNLKEEAEKKVVRNEAVKSVGFLIISAIVLDADGMMILNKQRFVM